MYEITILYQEKNSLVSNSMPTSVLHTFLWRVHCGLGEHAHFSVASAQERWTEWIRRKGVMGPCVPRASVGGETWRLVWRSLQWPRESRRQEDSEKCWDLGVLRTTGWLWGKRAAARMLVVLGAHGGRKGEVRVQSQTYWVWDGGWDGDAGRNLKFREVQAEVRLVSHWHRGDTSGWDAEWLQSAVGTRAREWGQAPTPDGVE